MTTDIYAAVESCLAEAESAILDLEANPADPALRAKVLRQLGVDRLVSGDPTVQTILDMVEDGLTPMDADAVDALLQAVEAAKRFLFVMVDRAMGPREQPAPPADAPAEPDHEPEPQPEPADAGAGQEDGLDHPSVQAATPEGGAIQSRRREPGAVKVSVSRLDELMEAVKALMVSNTVIAQHMRNMEGDGQVGRQVNEAVRDHSKTIDAVRNVVLEMRRTPLSPLFVRMGRVVRDVASKTGREVAYSHSGGELELDKSLVDGLGDPLVHLLRNAVDHGLESPEERRAAGKPAKGKVELRAVRNEEGTAIEIRDDGKGLDPDRILQKALERGVAKPGREYSRREIFRMITRAGFSTAEKTTEVSGRGVGMDVVVRALAAMDGELVIESEPGRGSCFRLALSSARASIEGIADGVVVCVAGDHFVLPAEDVVEVFEPGPGDISTVFEKGEVVTLRGRGYPLHRLRRIFGLGGNGHRANGGLAVVVEAAGERRALLVDDVVGREQVVVRGFERFRKIISTPLFVGVAVFGDLAGAVVHLESVIAEAEKGAGGSAHDQ